MSPALISATGSSLVATRPQVDAHTALEVHHGGQARKSLTCQQVVQLPVVEAAFLRGPGSGFVTHQFTNAPCNQLRDLHCLGRIRHQFPVRPSAAENDEVAWTAIA